MSFHPRSPASRRRRRRILTVATLAMIAIAYLDRWVSLHPDDVQARQLAQTERLLLGGGSAPGGMGRPPVPPPQFP